MKDKRLARGFLRGVERTQSLRMRLLDSSRSLMSLPLPLVPDPQNPTDFLSKWKPGAKFEASIKFLTGTARR